MVWVKIRGEIGCTRSFRERDEGWRSLKSHFLGKKGYLIVSLMPQKMIQSDVRFRGKY